MEMFLGDISKVVFTDKYCRLYIVMNVEEYFLTSFVLLTQRKWMDS